jgi:hypothetical protein
MNDVKFFVRSYPNHALARMVYNNEHVLSIVGRIDGCLLKFLITVPSRKLKDKKIMEHRDGEVVGLRDTGIPGERKRGKV